MELVLQHISKAYGPTQALGEFSLTFRTGEVHAIMGENGAGKSTLMKIISGAEPANVGQMTLGERAYRPRSPAAARAAGVAMVYQELTLAPDLTVEANVLLGFQASALGILKGSENRQRVREVLAKLQHPEIEPQALASSLSPGQQQIVELARALAIDAQFIILDEPTSSLSQGDASHLFQLIRELKERGVGIIYISHFFEEIEAIADRVTVLRDGRFAGTGTMAEVSREQLIQWMVGRSLKEQYPARVDKLFGERLIDVKLLSGRRLPQEASLLVRRGQILGIAGLIGSGRTELVRVLYGLDRIRSGEINVKQYSGFDTPQRRIKQGIGYLSEDRKGEGLALEQSITDNLTYTSLKSYRQLGLIDRKALGKAVGEWIEKLRIKCLHPGQPVGELSGGNQQKVALARILNQQAELLILDEPTRGVDVGSKAEIYALIHQQARAGAGIIMVSSYLPELFGLCDSIAVMVDGVLSETRPVNEWTPERIMSQIANHSQGRTK